MPKTVGVGVGVVIWRDGKVVLVQRKGSHGAGTWSIPGGKLDYGESWEECARREVLEEIGVKIKNVRLLVVTNDIFEADDVHFVSIFMESDWDSAEPVNKEPHKIAAIAWHKLTDLPSPLFEPCWLHFRESCPDLFKA